MKRVQSNKGVKYMDVLSLEEEMEQEGKGGNLIRSLQPLKTTAIKQESN